jgi:2-methylcitrate dehydratase PrpD
MKTNITKALSKFVKETTFEKLPKRDIDRMKMVILETIGCVVLGSQNTTGKILRELIKTIGGNGEATVFGTNFKTSPQNAALINGSMGYHYEYDDGISPAMGLHAGIAIIPAAIAIGETIGASGKELICSMITGYEIACRIGRAIGEEEGYRTSHSTPPLGSFGATVAACKLLGLDLNEINNAIGICGSLVSIAPFEPFIGGTMAKDMYGGWPSFYGAFVALLAQHGFTGLLNILEAKLGFFQVITGGKYNRNKLIGGLGKNYVWTDGHYFKPHAACRAVHLIVDCIYNMKNEERINIEKIKEILVIAKPEIVHLARGGAKPRNDIQAKVSAHYSVAVALILQGDHLSPDFYNDEHLHNPKILNLSRKVRMVLSSDSAVFHIHGHGPVEIIITFKDGTFRKGVFNEERSLEIEKIPDKFKEITLEVLPEKKILQIISMVSELEKIRDIRLLTELLV